MRNKWHWMVLSLIWVLIWVCVDGCGKAPQPDFDASVVSDAIVSEDGDRTDLISSSMTEVNSSTESANPSNEGEEHSYDSKRDGSEEGAEGSEREESQEGMVDGGEAPVREQVTLLMVGDILLHTPVEKSAKREDGSYSYDAIFSKTSDLISEADLALVNQEVILGGTELGISGYPAFNAPYEVGDDLVEAGFDVICHATNHAMDKGKAGVVNCLTYWEENHPEIQILGLHDEPDDPIYIYEKDGMRIAFLNYTYGTNGIALPADMPYAVDLLGNKAKVLSDIAYAESHADFTVVCPHWGTEYRLTADSSQEKWTKLFFENGVDLVLGTHPHVIEPVELLVDDETGHSMLVYYSLGNFVNWTSSSGDGVANRMVGGMAQITLERNEEGEVVISDYGVTALVCHLTSGQDGVTVWPLSDYTDALAEENAIQKQDPNFSLSYCTNLCDTVWGALWK